MASAPATFAWLGSSSTRDLNSQRPSFHDGGDFSILFSALLLAAALDYGDSLPLDINASLDSFFRFAHNSAVLKHGFGEVISGVLSCVKSLHGGEPRAPGIATNFRSNGAWHTSLRNISTGLFARASSVALMQQDDEPDLCIFMPDVVRALLAQLACEGSAEQDSISAIAARLLAWLSRHAPEACPGSSVGLEADSESSLLAAVGEAAGDFSFFGVEKLQAPGCVDARNVPKSMLRGGSRRHGMAADDDTVVVRATHVLQIGPPASDGDPPTQHLLWTLFINWTHMLIIKVSSGRSGPPVSVNVLLALADLTRLELQVTAASAPAIASTAPASAADLTATERRLMIAELKNAEVANAEQGAVRDFYVLPFAGAPGLLAVLRVLSARADTHALGVCGGVRLDNTAAIERAVANGVPSPESPYFGAGLFHSSGHYKGRTISTAFTVESRWSEDVPERRRGRGVDDSVDDSGRRSSGMQQFLRSVACPGVLSGGSRCEHCVAVFDSARKLKAESEASFADIDSFTSPPARVGGGGASPAVSAAAAFSRTPLAARRTAVFYEDASIAVLKGEISVLRAAYLKDRSALKAHLATYAAVHRDTTFVSLPEAEQDAVAHVVQYHDPTNLSMRLSSPFVSQEFATLIRWWFELQRLYSRTGVARLRIQYPVAVIRFCLDLYNRDSATYNLLRSHMHIPCPGTLKKYTALPNADGTDSPHAICSMAQFILRNGCDRDVILVADEVHLQEHQSVTGGATTRSNVVNLAPQHINCTLIATPAVVVDPEAGTASAVVVDSVARAVPAVTVPVAATATATDSAAPAASTATKPKTAEKDSVLPQPKSGVHASFVREATRIQTQAAAVVEAGSDSDDDDDDAVSTVKQVMGLTIGAVFTNSGKLMPMFYCPVESMRATSVYVLVKRALNILVMLGLVAGLLMTDGAPHFGRYGSLLSDVAWYGSVMPMINGIVCGEPNPFLGLSGMPLLICKDPEHFLKLFWMALTRSGIERKLGRRIMWYMSAALPMELFDELLLLDSADGAGAAATAHFLTELAVNPKGGAAMRPHLAKQFLDAGAGCLLPALADSYMKRPLPERRALVAMATVCAELGKAVEAVMSRSVIRGCPSTDALEAGVLHDSRQYTLPGGQKCHGKVRYSTSAQKTREHCPYVPAAMSAVCEKLCAETVYPGAATSNACISAVVAAANANADPTAQPPAAVAVVAAASISASAAELAVLDLSRHPLTRAACGAKFLRGWQDRAAAEDSRLAATKKAALAKIAVLARRPKTSGYVPKCLGGPILGSGRRISVICTVEGKPIRRGALRKAAAADGVLLEAAVGDKRTRASSAPATGTAVAAKAATKPAIRRKSAGAAKAAKPPPQPRTAKLPSLNTVDRAPTRQSIGDYMRTMYAMTFLVWCSVDCPNRLTTMVRRFCHANGLPVILYPWITATDAAAHLPLDAFDDVSLCCALAKVDINFMALLVLEDNGVPRPVMLAAEDVTRARLSILEAAQCLSQLTVAAPAPRSLSGLSAEQIASLKTLKLGMYHSTYLENFFAMLRGGTLMSRRGYGAIPSDAMPRTFGQGQSVLLNGSGRGTIIGGGESFRVAAAPAPLVWRTGAVSAARLNTAGADASAVALLPLSIPTLGGGSSSGQQTIKSSLVGNMSPTKS